MSSLFSAISGKITSSRFFGSLANAKGNVSSHYDLSNDMYIGQFPPPSTAAFRVLDIGHFRVLVKRHDLLRGHF